jgi:hypothetical protein
MGFEIRRQGAVHKHRSLDLGQHRADEPGFVAAAEVPDRLAHKRGDVPVKGADREPHAEPVGPAGGTMLLERTGAARRVSA